MFLGAQIDSGGHGTGGQGDAPPAFGNGGAGAYKPPVYGSSNNDDGDGGAYSYRPPVYNYGRGGDRVPPAMAASSAITRHVVRPWLPLLLLVFSF